MVSNKIYLNPSVVEVFSADIIRDANSHSPEVVEEGKLQKFKRKAQLLEQKGCVALLFGVLCIALDIFLTVTLHKATLPINHICPAFWLGICLIGCGLGSLTVAYRDPEEIKLNYISSSTKRALIGYYFFSIASLFIFSVIATTHIVLLSLRRPSLVDKRMAFLRMLYLTGFALMAGIWLIYARWSAKRRIRKKERCSENHRLEVLLCKDRDSLTAAEATVKEVFL